MIVELCSKWKIKHLNSSPYRPKINSVVEAANKNIKKIMQKIVVTYKDWHEIPPFALHTYHIGIKKSIRAIPYSLAYGIKTVIPLEAEISSLKVLMKSELKETYWVKMKYEQLNMISEKRLVTICHHQLYKKRVKHMIRRSDPGYFGKEI